MPARLEIGTIPTARAFDFDMQIKSVLTLSRRERVNWSLVRSFRLLAVSRRCSGVRQSPIWFALITRSLAHGESQAATGGYRSSRLRFSLAVATMPIMAGHFRWMAGKGEGKEPRGKSTPVAHCRERSLLTAAHTLLSLSLLCFLVLRQSNTLRSSPRQDGCRDSANNKYKSRRAREWESVNDPAVS